ncbi:T9SS type A sorting domain-containing protein [Aquiflexum gelatinilyticum]|nr:T9SS type A sorting domain-containing protein [Aquiflexum gelatinilyticum]MCS4432746.1 T9SS type A sorting domain-containing protein [Aquiflexum gelatinilyticum]
MKNFTIIMFISFVVFFQAIGQTQMNLPVTFDETNVNYGLVGFGGAEASSIVEDPTLATNKVAKVIKSAGAELWAGTTVTAVTGGVQTGFSTKIPFTEADKKMTVRVWSPDAGIKVRLKVEDHLDPTKSVETEATTTVAAAWETLTFDFGAQVPETAAINLAFNYNKASIFFNFGTTGAVAGEKTYYFDDMAFVTGGSGGGGDNPLPTVPLDFESEELNYDFINFEGGELTRIANSQKSGINTSNHVAQMVKGNGQVYAGSVIPLASPIDFSVGKIFKAKVFMPRVGAKLLLKVENQTNAGIAFEKEATGTKANEWEEITFDYSDINTANTYQKVVLIFDLGTMGDGSANFTYLIDDIELTSGEGTGGGDPNQMNLPVTFDETDVNYGLVGFGGAEASSIVEDPTLASNKVAKVIKSAGAELWAGTTVTAVTGGVQTGFSTKIPFTEADKKMTVRVWSPDAGIKVRLKVEDHLDPTKSVETEATTTVAAAWETLTFDFGAQVPETAAINLAFNYNKASIFFNFGTTGAVAGEKTYYFDDMAFVTGGSGGGGDNPLPTVPLDFESEELNYDFINFEGGELTRIANSQKSGINTSTHVAQMVKGNGQVYAGSVIPLASPIDFSVGKIFKAKVFMPRVGAKLLLKVENQTNAGIAFEKEATGTKANEWEEITFDYSDINTANTYQKVVLIFDLGTMGDGSANFTYLIDDIELTSGEGTGGGDPNQMNLPVTFDETDVNYGLVGFGGAEASSIVEDPTLASNKVAKVIKSAGAELWAGTTVTAVTGGVQTGFSTKIPFTEADKKMTVRVWSPDAGIKVRLKVEDHLDPTKSVETEATTTVAAAWETLTFDFGAQVPETAAINLAFNYNKASIFFNFGTTGAVAGEKTYYFDDMAFGAAVELKSQVITFPAIASKTLGDAPVAMNASSTSGLEITYSSSDDKITMDGNMATMTKAGRATITASQAGNNEFLPAEPVSQSFCINPAKPTISVSGTNTESVTLTSSAAAGNQWFLNGNAITGAVSQTLVVTTFGNYSVQVKVDDCLSTISDEVSLIINSAEIGKIQEMTVYPNPAENYIYLKGINGPIRSAEMIDMAGRSNPIEFELYDEIYSANVQNLSPGIYVLWIQQGNKSYPLRVIKK